MTPPFPIAVALLVAGCTIVAGCGGKARPASDGTPAAEQEAPDWRRIVTDDDRARLSKWRDVWVQALAAARVAGHGAKIAAEGVLLSPDAALGNPEPPPGSYRCRTVKLGAQAPGGLDYVAYPYFNCRIERDGAILRLTRLTGSQRPVGRLFPDSDTRMVFLGTLELADERMAMHYGFDSERDMIGAFERVAPRRWRLVLPSPRWESMVDVMELVPEGGR